MQIWKGKNGAFVIHWYSHTLQFLESLKWFVFSEQDLYLFQSVYSYLFVCCWPSHGDASSFPSAWYAQGLAQVLRKGL